MIFILAICDLQSTCWFGIRSGSSRLCEGTLPDMLLLVRMVYRGLSAGMTGNMFRTQDIRGCGFPAALHMRTALCPISTTFVVGA